MADDVKDGEVITFHPAECWVECDDKYCPYIHSPSWDYKGKSYQTKSDAMLAARSGGESARATGDGHE